MKKDKIMVDILIAIAFLLSCFLVIADRHQIRLRDVLRYRSSRRLNQELMRSCGARALPVRVLDGLAYYFQKDSEELGRSLLAPWLAELSKRVPPSGPVPYKRDWSVF